MSRRTGTSIIETLVVIAIIGMMLSLSLPALLSARRRALELQCKNNLHQINLAIADYAETFKRLPGPGSNGRVGGWTIDVLPFLDQRNLWDHITPGIPIPSAPSFLLSQPRIFRCPIQSAGDEPAAGMMEPSSYVFVPNNRRNSFQVFDAPLGVKVPWASGPEMTRADIVQQIGPHNRGFFYANGFQNGVSFLINGQDVR